VVFFLTALLIVIADQLSKTWIRSNLAIGASLPETGLFRLTHIPNTGSSFGLIQDQPLLLSIVALVGIVVIITVFFLIPSRFIFLDNRLSRAALGLVLGGAVGNLIDRLRLGHVTDFIDVGIWPAFNVADSAITVGAVLLVFSLLFLSRVKEG